MNRLLLAANVCLALFLGAQIWLRALPARAELSTDAATRQPIPTEVAELTPEVWPASEVHALRFDSGSGRSSGGRLLVDLGRPLATPENPPVLRLEPAFDCITSVSDPQRLTVDFGAELPVAQRFTLHLTEPVSSSSGAVLAAGPLLAFQTDPVELQSLTLRDDPAEEHVELILGFSATVTESALRDRLQLVDSATDRQLEFDIRTARRSRFGNRLYVRPQLDDGVTALQMRIEPGLLPRGGVVPTTEPLIRRLDLEAPLALTSANAQSEAIYLRFNRAIDTANAAADLREWIRLEPPLPFRVESVYSGLRLTGAFPAGEPVGVSVASGFPGSGRRRLKTEARRSLLVADLDPKVKITSRGNLLSTRAAAEISVESVGVDALDVRLRRVYPNNIVRMVQDGSGTAMAPAESTRIELDVARNERIETRLDLQALLGAERPARGLYLIDVAARDPRYVRAERLLQLTDLGISVRTANGTAAVQVVSVADGSPVANAELRVLSPTNQRLASGTTDARGIALLRWPQDTSDRAAFVVHARAGDDEAFVDAEGHAVELTGPELGGRAWSGDAPDAWVWPTRGILRPGEQLEATVLLRGTDGTAEAAHDVDIRLLRPGGRLAWQSRRATGAAGLLTIQQPIPADAPTGNWRLEVHSAATAQSAARLLGRTHVRVEAFVPLRLETEVLAIDPLRIGSEASIEVRARWLDGSPAANRPVTLRTVLGAGSVVPGQEATLAADDPDDGESVAEFSFATLDPSPPYGEAETLRGRTDSQGRVRFALQLPPTDDRSQTLSARLIAEVLDPSGRAVRAVRRAPVLRRDFHLGIRAHDDHVALCCVDAQGRRLAEPRSVRVRLERHAWRWVYRSLDGGRWRWQTEIDRTTLAESTRILSDGRDRWDVQADAESGWLVAVAECDGRRVEQRLGAAPQRPDRLRVRAPEGSLAPGEVATLQVTAPAAGRAFLTLEADRILTTRVTDLAQGRNDVEVALPADLRLPNVHAVVTLTRPAREAVAGAGPAWLIGATNLQIRRDDLPGDVELVAPAELRPGSTFECAVRAPGATDAVVALVDEGVLGITRHRDPDPRGHFLAARRLAGLGFDGMASLIEDARFVAGTKTGGDDGEDLLSGFLGGGVSPRIRPLARMVHVELDADGTAIVPFELPPDYAGRVRIMAVTAGTRHVAARSAATIVRAPLTLQLATPRMVAPGDRFALPLTVRNQTGAAGIVQLGATAAEAGLELLEDLPEPFELDDGEERTIHVALLAKEQSTDSTGAEDPGTEDPGTEDPGTEESGAGPRGQLRIDATLGEERTTIRQDVHVRTLRAPRVELLGLSLEQSHRIRLADAWGDAGAPGTAKAVLRVDAFPDGRLRPALEELLEYPFGCVEQTTSRGFAVLACSALLPRIYGDEAPTLDASELVQAAIDRLVGMQQARGGFGWWPGAHDEFAFGTLYAVDFLQTARELGYPVPDSTLEDGLERVKSRLRDSTRQEHIGRSAYAAEIASRIGAAPPGLLQWLATQVEDDEDRALLAIALQRVGETAAAQQLLEAISDPGAAPRSDSQRNDWSQRARWFRSPLRRRALHIRALQAVAPDDPELPRAIAGLQNQLLRPVRRNTQELGQVLRALAGYYRTQPRSDATEPVQLTGRLDGEPLQSPVDGRIEFPLRAGAVLELDAGTSGFAILELHGALPPGAEAWHRESDGEPSGLAPIGAATTLRLERSWTDIESGEQVSTLVSGRIYEVRHIVTAPHPVDDVVLVDFLPGGVEPTTLDPEHRMLLDSGDRTTMSCHIDRADDRVLLFPVAPLHGQRVLRHFVRATIPGTYAAPEPTALSMYDPTIDARSATAATTIEVEAR